MLHPGQAARIVLLTAAALYALAGCDRAPSGTVPLPSNSKRVVEFKPLAQLLPNRKAHIASDSIGNIFYTTETDNEQDVVSVVSDAGVPRSTQLTTANILAAMGETVGGRGVIQDLAQGPEDGIYFYFCGYKGSSIRTAVGVYTHRTGQISIAYMHQRLARHSGMGDSIGIARGTLIPGQKQMNLLLRHSDSWKLFAFDLKKPAAGVDLNLRQPMKEIRVEDERIDLVRTRYQLSPGIAGSFLLADLGSGAIWQVDAEGNGKIQTYLTGLPRDFSLPLVVHKDRLLLFIADSDPLDVEVGAMMARRLPQTTYPALVEVAGNDLTAIGREDFRVPPGFPAYTMRVPQIVQTSDGNYVGYEMTSGQLLKMRIMEEK